MGKNFSLKLCQLANSIIQEKTVLENLKETIDTDNNTPFESFIYEEKEQDLSVVENDYET